MDRFVCIHGHFYQPPRENPWLEVIEVQDSAYPYHDWNERITAESYGPNAASRILDGEGRIRKIVNNYSRMSFNFGPTLLSWLESRRPAIYDAVLQADRESIGRFSGHGSAIAQVYNHMILPLASARDRVTQIQWGIRDFERRFGRFPEGMWLAETAVDVPTLESLAEAGIRFTILAPSQAAAVRAAGEPWQEVNGAGIDPTRPYRCALPSGREIVLFFYDGPISRAVAFERLLENGERFASRLVDGFDDSRDWPQLLHIATDGETYGHHHRHGDMALAYALRQIETAGLARLTNYGEYLERFPPTHEVRILENTSWSCEHGIERWRSDCGCNSGSRPGWDQRWRAPLREALDRLRDALAPEYESAAGRLLEKPWDARDDYIGVVLDRSAQSLESFFSTHAKFPLSGDDRVRALKLLEMQRHAMLMYTSCGWFFDDLSGIETVQVIQYAARAVQLGQQLVGDAHEERFLADLEHAQSNAPEAGNGRQIFERFARSSMVGMDEMAAHYAVSSLFEGYPDAARVYSHVVEREDFRSFESGLTKLAVGRARFTSEITGESADMSFGVLHFGDHNVNGGVREFQGEESYQKLLAEASDAFVRADFPVIIRLFDRHFGESTYSLKSLFRDDQRRIVNIILKGTVTEADSAYRQLFDRHAPLMRYLADLGVRMPGVFRMTAEFIVNRNLRHLFKRDVFDAPHIRALLDLAKKDGIPLHGTSLGYVLEQTLGGLMDRLRERPGDIEFLRRLDGVIALVRELPFDVNLWNAQNVYYELLQRAYPEFRARTDEAARGWIPVFLALGEKLEVHVAET